MQRISPRRRRAIAVAVHLAALVMMNQLAASAGECLANADDGDGAAGNVGELETTAGRGGQQSAGYSGGDGGGDGDGGYGGGGYGGGGGYALQRWEEDYRHLKDEDARSDYMDGIKYIPFNEAGDVYLSLGGQGRYRYDYFNNPAFGPGVNDDNGFHLQRYLLHADLHLGPNLRTYMLANASFLDDRVGGPRTGDADHFDLQQAFVDVSLSATAQREAYVRLGRLELTYGAERLVSPDDWRNVRRTFDGVKASVSVPRNTTEVFWVRPVVVEIEEFNNDDPGSSFAGIYNATLLPDLIYGADAKWENYVFALNQTATSELRAPLSDANVYTIGSRLSARAGAFDFDVEGAYQFGKVGSDDLSAWMVAGEAGYTVASVMFSPRASLGLDIASGDDGGGRFNQLFPPTYTYLGHLYLFGRTNIVDVHAGLDLQLTPAVSLYLSHHVFWRQNTGDALYTLADTVLRADAGSDEAYVGNEFDVSLTFQLDRHVSGYVGWAHFFTGTFLEETGPSRDVDFVYASVTYTF